MYQQHHFQEERLGVMHDLIRAHPLATLVSYSKDGLAANHIPFVLHTDLSERGTLRGHVAKGNPIWKGYDKSVEVLAVFQGPQHYVTPAWYPSKKEHGRTVPTWNYVVVHAYGPMTVVDDLDWLLEHLQTLTSQHEKGRDQPWAVSDAPKDYIDRMLKGIIGLELPITRLEGKWKVSQNRLEKDREGVVQGLRSEGTTSAALMADLVSI
ncbi:MAG: FMN-binding negative transcriptional regulator [Rhodospirillales bacterium]|nr:FMN-binding negative transcriptional regulator [Rhodospirillales bacterium]